MRVDLAEWRRQPIGELNGVIIIGEYNNDSLDPNRYGTPQAIHYQWRDIGEISVYFEGTEPYVYLPHDDGEGISPEALRDLRELLASDVIERLVAIARQHIASPRLDVPLPPEDMN
jgi:hypothetical protein